jgi:hypothetical protein
MNAPTEEMVFSVVEAVGGLVVRRAARHALVAQPLLDQERQVEPDERRPEVELAQPLGGSPAPGEPGALQGQAGLTRRSRAIPAPRSTRIVNGHEFLPQWRPMSSPYWRR